MGDAQDCDRLPVQHALLIVSAQSATAETIKILLHNWSSQLVGARIVGSMLEMVGEKVAYVSADSQVVYTSMCEGDIHLVHEVWQGAFGVSYEKQLNAGCVITANTHAAMTREEWWYPEYVEKACPGLPDWKALNKCAAKFSTASTKPKGRFLAGPVDWLKYDQERVDGLGMTFKVVNAGSAAALWAELKSASKRQAPIMLFNWTPNFIEALYKGKFVESIPNVADHEGFAVAPCASRNRHRPVPPCPGRSWGRGTIGSALGGPPRDIGSQLCVYHIL